MFGRWRGADRKAKYTMMGASLPCEKGLLRPQHGPTATAGRQDAENTQLGLGRALSAQCSGQGEGAVPGPSVRVTANLGLVPNALASWRRRRYGTAALFAGALADATGLRITPAYARYWQTAAGVPPGVVVEAASQLLGTAPTLIWTQEQLRSLNRGSMASFYPRHPCTPNLRRY